MKKKENEKIEQPSLSDEQLEIFSAHMDKNGEDRSKIEPFDNSIQAKAMRYAKKNKKTTAAIVIAILSIIIVLVILIVSAISAAMALPNKDDFRIVIGENTYTADYAEIMINDNMYLDMNKLATLDKIQISGDSSSRKYTLPNLQYMRFEADSTVAIVDGAYLQMNAKAIFTDDTCLVPYVFLNDIFQSGIVFDIDDDKNIIKISRIAIGEDDDDNTIYEPLTVSNTVGIFTDIAYKKFGIDFFKLKKWIDPENNEEYLVLVNHSNPLPSTYKPTDLVQLTCDTNPVNPDITYYTLREAAEKSVTAMMDAMHNSGIDSIKVSSTYRSYERQEYLLNSYIDSKMSSEKLSYESAKKEVLKTLAIPGQSEHQTGLSVDFVQGTTSLTTKFEKTSSFAWLSQNAHKFGFILRYPADKVDITGYDYEPWHYRFVGRTVASRIYEAGICYEEYVALNS